MNGKKTAQGHGQPTLRARMLAGRISVSGERLAQDFARAVGGPVIYNQEFGLHPVLREQTTDCSFNPCFLIPSRDDHGASNTFRG